MKIGNILTLAICLVLILPLKLTLNAENLPPNILLLHSFHEDMPWSSKFHSGIKEAISNSAEKINFYTEYLDASRFKDSSIEQHFENHLANKYAEIEIGAVIADDWPASSFIEKYGDKLFPNAKAIFVSSVKNIPNPESQLDRYWLPTVIDYEKTIPLILDLKPETEKIVIVTDETKPNLIRVKHLKEVLTAYTDRIEIDYFTNFTLKELLEHAQKLPEKTAILYTLVFQDSSGKRFIPRTVAQQLSQKANAPVFTYWDALLGSGVVGGYMVSAKKSGEKAAELAITLINGKTVSKTELSPETQSGFFFDDAQLNRWKINSDHLPQNSTIINIQSSFFEEHSKETAFVLVFVLAQALLILFLYASRRKVSALAGELASSKDSLESTVYERTKDLQQLEERFRTLFEQSLDTIVLLKVQPGKPPTIHDINPEGCRNLGYEKDELVGQSLTLLATEENLAQMPARLEQLEAGKAIRFETEHVRKTGEVFPIEVVSKRIKLGNVAYYLAVERDISERKKREQEMIDNEEQLEGLIAERTDKLERTIRLMAGREVRMAELKKEIEQLNKQLSEAKN